jgi:hypothetical protein
MQRNNMKFRLRSLLITCFILTSIHSNSQTTDSKLIIEEYKIVSADISTPDRMEFKKYIDKSIYENRRKWGEFTYVSIWENETEKMNKILNDSGYYFEVINGQKGNQADFSFCYKDSIIQTKIYNIQGFDYDKQNKSFLFKIRIWDNHKSVQYLLYFDGKSIEMKPYNNPRRLSLSPIIVDTEVIDIVYTGKEYKYFSIGDTLSYAVKEDSNIVANFTTVQNSVSSPVKSFYQNNNDWILEYNDNALVSSINIRKKYNFEKIFSFIYLLNKPFFFFESDNLISISYNEELYQTDYDEIIYDKCCEASLFNIWNNNVMIGFFALKDGFWYYVEAGVYE